MTKLTMKEQVLAFDRKKHFTQSCVKVTTNGEISYLTEINEFLVFDETYAYEVCRTSYPLIAVAAHTIYCEQYLEGKL